MTMTTTTKTTSTTGNDPVADFDRLPDSAIIRLQTVRALLGGVSEPTIRRRYAAGEMPKPVKVGARAAGWRVGDMRRYLGGLAHGEGE